MNRYQLTSGNTVLKLHDDTTRAAPPASGWGAVDAHGCSWAAAYPDGWEDLEFLTPVDTVSGVDGGLVGPQSIGVRTISLQGTIVGPTRAAAEAATSRLRNALPNRGSVTFTVADDTGTFYVIGRPVGKFNATPTDELVVEYSFALTCTDPYKRSTAEHSLSTGLPHEGASTGLVLGTLVLGSLVLTTSAPEGGALTVDNLGTADALPVVTIEGPVWDPIVRNVTTGEYTQWNITLAAGQVLVVDYATRLTTLDGVRVPVQVAGYGATLWSLPPGISDIQFRTRDSLYDPAAALTVAWKDGFR